MTDGAGATTITVGTRPPVTREISLDAIRDSRRFVYQAAVRTPLVRLYPPGDEGGGPEIYLKLETLQPIGSFKIRGAQNAVRQLSPEQLAQGVWTVSAGNAAQGVALAARLAGAACSVMVMDTAPAAKLRAIERLGARDRARELRRMLAHRRDASAPIACAGFFVHPFDDDRFIAGNGTAGLEILEDLPDVDAVVASMGGGGLLARHCHGAARAASRRSGSMRPNRRRRRRSPRRSQAGEPCYFDGWQRVVRRRRRGQVRARRRCGRCCRRSSTASIVVSLDEVARGHASRRRTRPCHRRRRRRVRGGGRAHGAAGPRQGRRGGLRRQHRPGAFATLVGCTTSPALTIMTSDA